MGVAHLQSGPRPLFVGMKQGARPGRPASQAALRSLTCRRWAASPTSAFNSTNPAARRLPQPAYFVDTLHTSQAVRHVDLGTHLSLYWLERCLPRCPAQCASEVE